LAASLSERFSHGQPPNQTNTAGFTGTRRNATEAQPAPAGPKEIIVS
jgi:hypothetical protein